MYQKPVNTYLYLPFFSFHPRHCKIGWIRGELRRFLLRSFDPDGFAAVCATFYKNLRARGYPPSFLEKAFGTVAFADRPSLLSQATSRKQQQQQQQQQRQQPHRGPIAFKVSYIPVFRSLSIGFLLRRLKSGLNTHGFRVASRFVVAWKLPKGIRHFLVRSKLWPIQPRGVSPYDDMAVRNPPAFVHRV